MHTTSKTITTVALVELREALRPHLAACGLDADRMIFPMQELKPLEVASVYDGQRLGGARRAEQVRNPRASTATRH